MAIRSADQEWLRAKWQTLTTSVASDVAAAVRFLVSDDAGYITGQVIHVNGGMLMA